MPDQKAINRQKRGQTNQKDLLKFTDCNDNELITLLKSELATERTYASQLLGKRKASFSIETLIESLKVEKALYARIAISKALGNIGLPAVEHLIDILGKIGNNQYEKLPDKPFEKWNYPLPRDIVARTLTKIGTPALKQLIDKLSQLPVAQLSEAIDTIGYISFYTNDISAFEALKHVLNTHKNNYLIIWKANRALQSFPSKETIDILESYLVHEQPAIRWETIRSLAQISVVGVSEKLSLSLKDNDLRVRKMAKAAIKRIENQAQKTSKQCP